MVKRYRKTESVYEEIVIALLYQDVLQRLNCSSDA